MMLEKRKRWKKQNKQHIDMKKQPNLDKYFATYRCITRGFAFCVKDGVGKQVRRNTAQTKPINQ